MHASLHSVDGRLRHTDRERSNYATNVSGFPLFASSFADSIIQMDMYSLHFSPELWGPVDPNVFFPDRHRNKRHRLANVSFGCGPKNCVGQRFALFIIKSTLVRLLRHFIVLPGLDIDLLLNIQERSVITPREVRIRMQRRC